MSFHPIPVRLPQRQKNAEAMALIVVLFILALVTITILAFFSQAMLNRNISFSSAGQARANLVALSGLNYVKGDLLEEIQEGSTQELDSSGVNVPIYAPTSNTNMAPYRMTANISSTNIPANLIKWSSGTYAQWPATGYTQAGPTRAASGNSTLNGSSTGRYIASSRWNKPQFNVSSTSTNVIPDWVLITREGPMASASSAQISTLANPSAGNPNYVVGRYAYVVYDEGGLVDVTAAGYSPTTFPANDSTGVAPTYVGRKGSQGFADLTQLGLTSAQVDQLVNWRNATTGLTQTNYISYLTTNAPSTGFLQAAAGDHAFLSRQDLIQYWTTELGANTNYLQYVTTFSREKNAPSWGPEHDANDPTSPTYWNGVNTDSAYDSVTYNDPPALSYAYHSNRDSSTAYNRFFPNVRVKTAFKRLSNEEAVVGEPLVRNRFDLSKLAWISYTGVPPTGVSYQDIYNYFGLIANFSSSGVFLSWTYNHTAQTVPATVNGTLAADTSKVMTLDQVASLPSSLAREPDFFELLQATILQGSLGLASGDPTQATIDTDIGSGGEFYRAAVPTAANALDVGGALYRPMNLDTGTVLHIVNAQSMYQIIQIGANMIDQADNDNFPTEIVLNGDHFYGVENLPYISGIGDSALRVAASGSATAPAMSYDVTSSPDSTISGKTQYQAYVHHWLNFALWNPHQNAANPPTTGPTTIRICVAAGQEFPYISNLGKFNPISAAVGGTDFSGRIFEAPGTSVNIASASSPAYADGPAWIGLTLSSYNNFSEPAMINYANSFTSDSADPGNQNINDPDGRIQTSNGWQRAGIYLGWSYSPDNPYKVPACVGLYPNYTTASPGTAPSVMERFSTLNSTIPLTIYLQYQDINNPGTWHTYQELRNLYYSRGAGTGDAYMEPNDTSWTEWLTVPKPLNTTTVAGGTANTLTVSQLINGSGVPTTFNGAMLTNMDTTVVIPLDPRTDRQNLFSMHNSLSWGRSGSTGSDSMVTSIVTSASEPSKGFSTGPHFENPALLTDATWSSFAKTWIDNISVSPMKNYDQMGTTTYYRDRDYIPRVGDAAGWTNVILPSGSSASETSAATPLPTGAQMQRPLHLDRPFRSVAELGYVFRDDPWKTLNLISANSADSGLLDIFYVGSSTTSTPTAPAPDIVAGKMNINSAALNVIATGVTPRTSPVLQTLISQAVRDYQSPSNNSGVMATAITSSSDITNLSTNVVNYIRTNGPLTSISDLPSLFPQVTAATPPTPLYTGLKNPSEAFIRALSDSSGTRTWNLMIDIIAQSGRYSTQATSLNSFTVEGEKHYWLHVAIDRFTGEIVDQQIEPVSE